MHHKVTTLAGELTLVPTTSPARIHLLTSQNLPPVGGWDKFLAVKMAFSVRACGEYQRLRRRWGQRGNGQKKWEIMYTLCRREA